MFSMRHTKGFTLIEMMVTVMLTGMILLTAYGAFQNIIATQAKLGATIDIQRNLFYTNEKLAALIRTGGTIDYEEYFNRRQLGYAQSKVSGKYTFTTPSLFWNQGTPANWAKIYYCGIASDSNTLGEENCITLLTKMSDSKTGPFSTAFPLFHQAYGQYQALYLNYADPVGFPMPMKLPPILKSGDSVGIFLRKVPPAVSKVETRDVTKVGLPELYLIKKQLDNKYIRTYFRHVYVDDPFDTSITCDPKIASGGTDNINGCLGKIQMTQLESCDTAPTDGIIESWIPTADFSLWWTAVCKTTLAAVYQSAHEIAFGPPGNESANLVWVDVTSPDLNVIRATFLPSPLKIPALMSGAGDPGQSPSVSLYLEVQLSTKLRNKSFVKDTMNYPRTLITTYDLSE